MTNLYDLPLTIEFNLSGFNSFQTSVDSLAKKFHTPVSQGGDALDSAAAADLESCITGLVKLSATVYDGLLPYVYYLDNLQVTRDTRIGKNPMKNKFWDYVPQSFTVQVGQPYSDLYAIKNHFMDEIKFFTSPEGKEESSRLNRLLDGLSRDCHYLIEGKLDAYTSSVIDPSWMSKEIGDSPSVPSSPVKPPRWADMSSSEDDESLVGILRSLTIKKESKTPGVQLPGDFLECFPSLGKKINLFCDKHGWTLEYVDSVSLRRQALIPFKEEGDRIEHTDLKTDERLALLSIYGCVSALFLKPQCFDQLGKNNTEVALTYVYSIIAREKLARSEDRDLLKIALKNGDGGKAVLKNRLLFLTKSGDSAVEMIFKTLEKLVSKFASELKDDQLDVETQQAITSRAFTSVNGMLDNCYRKSKVPIVEPRTVAKKKTKQLIKVRDQEKTSPPNLSLGGFPFKPDEVTNLQKIKDEFNNRAAEVARRVSKVSNPDIFTEPKVCKEVVTEAYEKLRSLKMILKDRTIEIRALATKSNNGAKPGPSHWANAKAEVLSKTPSIKEEVWNHLKW